MQVSIGNTEILRRVVENMETCIKEIMSNHPSKYTKETNIAELLVFEQGKFNGMAQMVYNTGRHYRIKIEIINEDKTVLDLNSPQTSFS